MTLVIDASVLNKLFLKEIDTPEAVAFLKWAVTTTTPLIAPQLLRQEMCLAALHYGISFAIPLDLLGAHIDAGMRLVDPPRDVWLKAEEISCTGHAKSGYPSLQDSLYHALAIYVGGTMVTADTRHLAKTAAFGHAVELADWALLAEQ